MVISLALLLARCYCIFMLLLSFANVTKNINTAVVVAIPSPLNSRATGRYDGNDHGNTDPCYLSNVAPRNGWTRTSTRSGGLTCEYHLNIARPDHEHLVQLNLSLGPLFDMQQTPGHGQQQQESRTTPTNKTPTTAIRNPGNSAGTTVKPTPLSHLNNNNNIRKNSNGNINNKHIDHSGSDPSLTTREETSPSSAIEHSRKHSGTHPSPSVLSGIGSETREGNRTSDSDSGVKLDEYSQHDGDPNSKLYIDDHLVNASHDYESGVGDNDKGDDISKDISESSNEFDKDLPTVRATLDSSGGKEPSFTETESFCVLKLIVQGPHDTPPQNVCLRDGQGLSGIIYYYRDALNVTVTWDPRFGPGLHLTYTMVPAAGVKCSVRCSNSHLCLFESQLCDNHADCPDGADERRKECSSNRSSPQLNQDQSTLKIALIITGVGVLVFLAVCCCILLRRNVCRLNIFNNRDTLLRQQQRPHSHSSEMYRSPSGSMQDASGTYDPRAALLQDRCHQPSSSHSHRSSHTQSSPRAGIPNSHQHQPSSLPSHHQHAPLSPSFRPPQSSMSPCIGSDGRTSRHFLSQDVSKPSSSRSPPGTYPPHIAMSRDGEEGYKASQQALHSSHQLHQNWLVQNEVFRPPPNKTIFDRDSPPPPYSFSAPTSTKSPELLAPGMSGVSMPRLMCTSNNNNNNKHNNNNMDNCKNRGSPQSANVPGGCPVSCPPHPASIYPPNRLSASGPPPDYHQVAATFSQMGQNPSDSSAALPNQRSPPDTGLPFDMASSPSLKGPFWHTRPSPMFRTLSPLADSSNTFVVTNGSPSVCPGPDADNATHHSTGSETGGGRRPETTQEDCAPPTSWPSGTVPSLKLPAPRVESPLLSSSSCSTSSHVPVLPTPSFSSASLSFSCRVDPGHHLASATSIAAPALEHQAPGYCLNNNNNINNNHHHNNYNMNNNITTDHCNNIVNNGNNINNNNTYCNNNNDVDCVANNCGISSDDSLRFTLNKALPLPSTARVTNPSPTTSSHDAVNSTTPLSPPLSLSSHHQHLQARCHHLIHNQPASQTQPSWHEASHQMSFDATAHCSAPKPPLSPSLPTAVTNSEYDHVPEGGSGLVSCSESNGNVFLGHDPSPPAPASLPAVTAQVLDPNGNNSEGPMARDACEQPSSPAQNCPGVAVMDPTENCDWSKSVKALSRSPLVSSSVNPCADSTPCCDNTSAATTRTATASSSSSSSSSSLGVPPVNTSMGPAGVEDIRFMEIKDKRRKQKKEEDASMEGGE